VFYLAKFYKGSFSVDSNFKIALFTLITQSLQTKGLPVEMWPYYVTVLKIDPF
jgi:hypothetical protein